MISDWRGDRRIGPEGIDEPLGAAARQLFVALAGATAVVALIRLIETVIPTGRVRDPVIIWALVFGSITALKAVSLWSRSRVVTAGMLLVAALILALELQFGMDLLLATGAVSVIVPNEGVAT